MIVSGGFDFYLTYAYHRERRLKYIYINRDYDIIETNIELLRIGIGTCRKRNFSQGKI
jgi:hypothetical protein